MDSQTRQYVFGAIFIAVGGYQFYISEFLEFSMYVCAGSAFVFNALINEPKLQAHKKPLVVITWILIAAATLLFFYLLRYKFL
jgi:hypothetical protein